MDITVCFSKINSDVWVKELQLALPKAKISTWRPGTKLADIAVVWEPSQQFIDEQADIKALFNIGAGVDAILKLKLPPNLKIIRVDDDNMSLQMAEYVCHEVIRHFRKFDNYYEDSKRSRWSYHRPLSRMDYPVGIMGMGILGNRVAKTLKNFEFKINCYSRSYKQIEGISSFVGKEQLQDFLRASKILINLLPLTPETENILNYQTLSQLQPGGYVINAARGQHLVDDDLLMLIDSGHLSGASLDVFCTEPLPKDHIFWKHPQINITPHISARMNRKENIKSIVEKIQALIQEKPISGLIDQVRGY